MVRSVPFRSAAAAFGTGKPCAEGLIWYCAVSNDEDSRAIALWLLDAKWRQKRNTEKSIVALTELGIAREELLSRELIRERLADPMPKYLDRLKESLSAIPFNRIVDAPEEDLLIVQGQFHFYRISRSEGRVERATDDVILELDWHALPDQFRLTVSRDCDSPHQVQMRAFLLMNDGLFGQYFKEVPDQRVRKTR